MPDSVAAALATYARGADRADAALIADAFWPEARITLGSIHDGGRDGFVQVCLGFMGMFAATRHDLAQVLTRPHADGGLAYEAYVRAWHLHADRSRELVVLGRYVGRAEQRGGEWRLIEHGELMDWGEERAVDAGWFTANNELPKGRRDRDDGSYALLP